MRRSTLPASIRARLRGWTGVAALVIGAAALVRADGTPQGLPFAQAWTDTTLISVSDDWSRVPGVQGFLGQGITGGTGVDPQTLLTTSTIASDLDVNANQTNPNTFATGGVAEFDTLANPIIALNGSGTADAPYLLLALNTTGQSSIRVSYTLRDLDGSSDNAVQPVALQFRAGSTGAFTNVPAGFVADATTGPSLAILETPVSVVLPAAADDQAELQVRIITANAVGNDEWVGVDDIEVTAGGGPPQPAVSVDDITVTEGDSGLATARVVVRLSQPAGAGGVTFDVTTTDGTALAANADYVPLSLTNQSIAEGTSQVAFDVSVVGDTFVEATESLTFVVSNVAGALVADDAGAITIANDDVQLTAIHAIQGPGSMSPLVGATVSTRGIVTALKSNAFFLQTPDTDADANPLTSEGIVVFTGSAPPAVAAVGSLVQVTGVVQEFVPGADPAQPPLTEIGNVSQAVAIATGQALPTPIQITASDINPTSGIEALERVEGMRVAFAS